MWCTTLQCPWTTHISSLRTPACCLRETDLSPNWRWRILRMLIFNLSYLALQFGIQRIKCFPNLLLASRRFLAFRIGKCGYSACAFWFALDGTHMKTKICWLGWWHCWKDWKLLARTRKGCKSESTATIQWELLWSRLPLTKDCSW